MFDILHKGRPCSSGMVAGYMSENALLDRVVLNFTDDTYTVFIHLTALGAYQIFGHLGEKLSLKKRP